MLRALGRRIRPARERCAQTAVAHRRRRAVHRRQPRARLRRRLLPRIERRTQLSLAHRRHRRRIVAPRAAASRQLLSAFRAARFSGEITAESVASRAAAAVAYASHVFSAGRSLPGPWPPPPLASSRGRQRRRRSARAIGAAPPATRGARRAYRRPDAPTPRARRAAGARAWLECRSIASSELRCQSASALCAAAARNSPLARRSTACRCHRRRCSRTRPPTGAAPYCDSHRGGEDHDDVARTALRGGDGATPFARWAFHARTASSKCGASPSPSPPSSAANAAAAAIAASATAAAAASPTADAADGEARPIRRRRTPPTRRHRRRPARSLAPCPRSSRSSPRARPLRAQWRQLAGQRRRRGDRCARPASASASAAGRRAPDATDCGERTCGVRGAGGGAVIFDRRVVNCCARVFSSSVFSMSSSAPRLAAHFLQLPQLIACCSWKIAWLGDAECALRGGRARSGVGSETSDSGECALCAQSTHAHSPSEPDRRSSRQRSTSRT